MQDKKHILLVAPYLTFPNEMGMNRFIYLAKLLSNEFEVTLVTSRFCHFLKKQRGDDYSLDNVKIVLLDEPGYKKNVSIKRLTSHYHLCRNFELFLQNYTKKIDIAYSAYPLIKTNYILGKYKTKKGYKLVIDVQDIWPEAITGPIAWLSGHLGKLLMAPITQYANKTYGYADGLVAVSETYLQRADVQNLPNELKTAVYIGGNDLFYKENKQKSSDKLIATYLGTMAGSYDLETIVRAAPLCHESVRIQFIGTGPNEASLKALNQELGGYVDFLGVQSYQKAIDLLSNSDIALNAIKATSQGSITNKLSDYICCGLPILSCQKQAEVETLLSKGGGVQYMAGDNKDLAQLLIGLAENRDKLADMSSVNLSLAEEYFIRSNSYEKIKRLIKRLI